MKYELVIFDMDGTILDTLKDLSDAANYALIQNGFSARTEDEIRQFVGNGLLKLIDRSCPADITDVQKENVRHSFLEFYSKHCADNTKPYEGIVPLLHALKESGIKTAVNSNKPDEAVQELCGRYFRGLFDIQIGSRSGVRNKPAPDSVNQVLSYLKIDKSQAVYVGDSDVDIATAKNSGIDGIGVEWGFRGKDFLVEHGADVTVGNTEELKTVLGL